ncbi:NAD(P)-dependent alcohol dehydrogenase [Catellatospora sichuanensis]|uniref:NAD(P)-dependent alcohol dehydrogenase n=1 Tax=Catellatospora sichuanensis TaxID=1969805 RepID=UPI001181E2D0|nr:NAD(P)-dependent alcohol dehydrogenase [Catellatospora sichuanensis]
MKAIVRDRYGSADVLRCIEVPRPAVGPEQVLVRVHACSLNFGDRVALRGEPTFIRLFWGLRRPRVTILGRDVAGTVVEVGAKVTRWQPGDEVFGEMDQRGFAEYVAAPADHLARKPAGVGFEQAATLPVAATTALQALRLGGVTAGSRVLVNGASGGVGTFAVQLAVDLGAQVTGVCSTRNAELVRSLGADVVDYTREDFTRGDRSYDVVLDLAGGHRLAALRRVLAPGGVYLSSSGAGGRVLGPLPHLLKVTALGAVTRPRLRVVAARRDTADLDHLATLVAAGRITPVIERTRPLSEAADVFRALDTDHARGKIVLTVG